MTNRNYNYAGNEREKNKIRRRYKPFPFEEVSCFAVNLISRSVSYFATIFILKPYTLRGVLFALQTHR